MNDMTYCKNSLATPIPIKIKATIYHIFCKNEKETKPTLRM